MTDTLKSMRVIIQKECRGDFASSTVEDDICNDAINDAIESVWMAMMQVQLAKFFGADSPVTFSLPANAEQFRIISIADPTVAPTVSQVVGGAPADNAIYVVGYTFVTESGSETLMSPTSSSGVRGGTNVFQVASPANPGTAFGWNLYAGPTLALMALQNQQPLPFSPPSNEPVSEWQGYPTNEQIPPTVNATADNLSWIEHLEITHTDQTRQAWNQVDIDSQIMRRMAAKTSSASEYQSYVWELMNNGVLEFRPTTGLAFSPRYWYVAKPRRLRYDQAEIPYVSIMGVHKFIKAMAKSDLYLTVNEFLNSSGWEQKAEKEKLGIQMSLMQESWGKNTRISPYLFTTLFGIYGVGHLISQLAHRGGFGIL